MTTAPRRTRVFSLNPDLGDPGTFQVVQLTYEIERALARAAAERGVEYLVLGGVDARPPSDFPAPVVPVFTHRTTRAYRPNQWPAQWRQSRDFCDRVLEALDRCRSDDPTGMQDVLFLYTGHPADIPAMIRLGLVLGGRSPVVLNLYHLHLMYGTHRPRSVPGLRQIFAATRGLRRAAHVHLCVDTERLAELVRRDTGETVAVLPFFSPAGDAPRAPAPRPSGRPYRLVYPTAMPSGAKGFDLVVALGERLGRRDVEIIVREPGRGADEACLTTLAAQRGGVVTIPSFLSHASYTELIEGSDLVLVPYRSWEFLTRTSGVVADALLFGKPMVGTAGTWIGDQIEELGAGTTFPDGDVQAFVAAVRSVLDDLERFRRQVAESRARWLARNNAGTFLRAVIEPETPAARRRPGGVDRRATGLWRLGRSLRLVQLATLTHARIPARVRVVEPGWLLACRFAARLLGITGSLELTPVRDPLLKQHQGTQQPPLIRWRTRGVEQIEIRLDAPDGFLVTRGGPTGALWGGWWIGDGRLMYLQDVTREKPLRARHTLHRLELCLWDRRAIQESGRAARRTPGRTLALLLGAALPIGRVVRRAAGMARGTLAIAVPPMTRERFVSALVSWQSARADVVEIRVGHPGGKLFARERGTGSTETGPWVTDGTALFLLDASRPHLAPALRLLDMRVVSSRRPRPAKTSFGRLLARARRLLERTVWPADPGWGADAAAVPRASAPKPSKPSISTAVAANEWGVRPPRSTGEVYLLATYSASFLERYGGDRLVIFGSRSQVDICRLFPDAPVAGREMAPFDDEEWETRGQSGRAFQLNYANAARIVGDVSRYCGMRLAFAELLFDLVRLPLGRGLVPPRVTGALRDAAWRTMRALGLREGRTAILAPTASTPPPPFSAWTRIADELRQRGFTVATNAGPGEPVLPGTVPLRSSLSELFAMIEIGGLVLSARSGLCEICCANRGRLHILQRDLALVALSGITILPNLADNGLPDRAVYHTMGLDEDPLQFADRVVAHPDLA